MFARNIVFHRHDKGVDRLARMGAKEAWKGFLEGIPRHFIILASIAAQRKNATAAERGDCGIGDLEAEYRSVKLDHKCRIGLGNRLDLAWKPRHVLMRVIAEPLGRQ